MLDFGEKLRTARRRQNLSLRELAAKAEVSASLLSQIENGKANPSVRSLYSIADALGLPLDHFFPNDNEAQTDADPVPKVAIDNLTPSQVRAAREAALIDDSDIGFDTASQSSREPVVRADARQTIELLGGIIWERLTTGPEDNIEFLRICYDAGTQSGEKMSHHPGREFHFILEGELRLELGFECHRLKAGDSIIFDSTVPHRLSNPGQEPMRAITVIFNQE